MSDVVGGIALVAGVVIVALWLATIADAVVRPKGEWEAIQRTKGAWVTLILLVGVFLFPVGTLVISLLYLLWIRKDLASVVADRRVSGRQVVSPAVLDDVPPEPGVRKPDPILVVDDLRRRFGGIKAVDVQHLEIQRGLITGLIGPNGAGKTTLFNLLTGFDNPDDGRWVFDGMDMTGAVAHQMADRGMVRTFQLTKALARMTVLDNMMLGATGQRGEKFLASLVPPAWQSQDHEIEARAMTLLDRFGIEHMAHEYAGTLSGGQRKLLEMARALMTEPELVMLDEPMAGVNPALTQSLLEHVRELRDEGMSVIFVEHDMDVVRDVSDWVVVMAEGEIIAEGTHEVVTSDRHVIDAYLGTQHDEPVAAPGGES